MISISSTTHPHSNNSMSAIKRSPSPSTLPAETASKQPKMSSTTTTPTPLPASAGLQVKRLGDKASLPTRGSPLAAGYDLYAYVPYRSRLDCRPLLIPSPLLNTAPKAKPSQLTVKPSSTPNSPSPSPLELMVEWLLEVDWLPNIRFIPVLE